MPVLAKIDHIHIYAPDRLEAEKWYTDVLGFERIESLMPWFEEGGPLTMGNGGVHIALFDGDSEPHPRQHSPLMRKTISRGKDTSRYML
ncbi:hypothetical protein CS022_22840 [Veronia nyctiphanis]|uniref:Glyoxalase/fosfomycin resistance/dioxygenase domain-containing protein n=1 Tax=Veronia nyctiphanis TaxID=1278244 RepID=A0A4Q0YIT6_9GAMM|nr:VOC family protein [Veronia nyctiphanis]RXJ70612.1 hypothetical protein CS022_22840 [Veronia nyctiphanis]